MKKILGFILSYTEIWWICVDCKNEQKNQNKCEKCGGGFLRKGEDDGGGHE